MRVITASVVILIINKNNVAVLERESQTPIAIGRHTPVISQPALERVQSPTGQVHICRGPRALQCGQLPSEPCRMRSLNTRFTSRFKEPLDAFVPKATDHDPSVARGATVYKLVIVARSF